MIDSEKQLKTHLETDRKLVLVELDEHRATFGYHNPSDPTTRYTISRNEWISAGEPRRLRVRAELFVKEWA